MGLRGKREGEGGGGKLGGEVVGRLGRLCQGGVTLADYWEGVF